METPLKELMFKSGNKMLKISHAHPLILAKWHVQECISQGQEKLLGNAIPTI
jgi:hypothetical protein